MLLRSSSSPALQSHIFHFSDSPTRGGDTERFTNNNHPSFPSHCNSIHPLIHAAQHFHSRNFSSLISCNSSPGLHSPSGFSQLDQKPPKSFRRAWSHGSLEGLASTTPDLDELCTSKPSKSICREDRRSMLQSVPSFSIFSAADGVELHERELGENELKSGDERLERSVTIGDSIEAIGSGDFSFGKSAMGLIQEEDCGGEDEEDLYRFQNLGIEEGVESESSLMYLAAGFGLEGKGFGGGNGGGGLLFNGTGFDDESGCREEHYRRMVVEDPCNPLFLRNYAQLLQSKGDLHGAEEFYLRAALADPQDGEILLQCAKLVWELHHDQDRALIYFERATLAAPEDSHVLAAYASFLWEIDEDKEEDQAKNYHLKIQVNEGQIGIQNLPSKEGKIPISSPLHFSEELVVNSDGHGGTGNIVHATNSGHDGNLDEHYKRMIEESPGNSLFLRNYAQFLLQSKGDRRSAEEYYSRAILADPEDGETISQYAKLVWELHHDQDKAACYFERAVQASPRDCHVLAAYASFLWETEDVEEEPRALLNQLFPGDAIVSASS